MGVFIRYAAVALVSMAAAIFAISPFANTLVEQWSIPDVELRSTLVFKLPA